MKFNLAVIFLFISALSYGQFSWTKGAIILKSGETVEGFVKLSAAHRNDLVNVISKEKVRYRNQRKGKTVKYTESEVERVIINRSDTATSYYVYVQLSKKRKFVVEEISKGKANLFKKFVSYPGTFVHGYQFSGGHAEEYFVLREGEEIATPLLKSDPVSYLSFKKRAKIYFQDCKAVVDKIDGGIFSVKNVEELVEEYNACNE